jgi:hypothetical protein
LNVQNNWTDNLPKVLYRSQIITWNLPKTFKFIKTKIKPIKNNATYILIATTKLITEWYESKLVTKYIAAINV